MYNEDYRTRVEQLSMSKHAAFNSNSNNKTLKNSQPLPRPIEIEFVPQTELPYFGSYIGLGESRFLPLEK